MKEKGIALYIRQNEATKSRSKLVSRPKVESESEPKSKLDTNNKIVSSEICYGCNKKRHFKSQCPLNKNKEEEKLMRNKKKKVLKATWDKSLSNITHIRYQNSTSILFECKFNRVKRNECWIVEAPNTWSGTKANSPASSLEI